MEQKPTVGRIVHINIRDPMTGQYSGQGELTRPAIITGLNEDGTIDLMAFADMLYPRFGVQFSETPKLDCWSWPPRS